MHVGIAGIGKMGGAMALRLLDVGHQVTVWNRTVGKTQAAADAGAQVAPTAAALANATDATISILSDSRAIDAVYHGPSGLLSGDVRGKLLIEMSTVQPEIQIALAEKVRGRGAAFVECPVGGSTGPARQGKLLALVGAESADVERARDLLGHLCRRIEHAGPVGAGAVLKFTINLPLMIYWQALGEALALVRPIGFDPDRLMGLMTETSGGINALKARGPGIARMLRGGDPGPVTFDVDGGIKDIQSMLTLAKARGLDLPLLERALACYQETARHRPGGSEVSAVSVYWAQRGKR